MNENVKILFGLLGGLAMFLYGMNSMSDALQKAAGEKMKKVLAFLTKNPIMGALAGAFVTAVLQSSSATTVMVIGFVSAGLMSLPQAVSVIFGANIGTTMTAQLMAFKISNYIYPIIFIGFLLNFVCKKEKIKNIGMVLFSFGLLFEGIEIMGTVMKPLADSPVFVDLMAKVSDIPVLGVLLGAVMTLIVQSSSATIAVLQNFASQPGPDGVTSVIGLMGALPILLGDNIGTTITALLASIGQSKNAKRTAVAHSVFNISGSILFLFFLPVLAGFVQFISPKGNETAVISRQIANAHTTFNIVCTLIWLPLIPVMIRIVRRIISGEDRNNINAYEPKYIDDNMLNQPVAALYLASKEIKRLGECTEDLFLSFQEMVKINQSNSIKEKYEKICQGIKLLENAIIQYISKMFATGVLTENQVEVASGLLFVTNNIERVIEQCENIEKGIQQIEQGNGISREAKEEISKCIGLADRLLQEAMKIVYERDKENLAKILKGVHKMRKIRKQNYKSHLERVKTKKCSTDYTIEYSRLMDGFERIAHHCLCIAEQVEDTILFQELES